MSTKYSVLLLVFVAVCLSLLSKQHNQLSIYTASSLGFFFFDIVKLRLFKVYESRHIGICK